MNLEAGGLREEEERKKRELSEKEKAQEKQKNIELKKQKEAVEHSEKTENQLNKLRDLLDDGKLDGETQKLVEKVTTSEFISEDEIQEIFDKIDEIESVKNIDDFLPKDFRVTKEEYQKAIDDDVTRVQTLTKLNTALTMLARHAAPDGAVGLNLFSGFMAVLDKNLIKIQENHIDIKGSLEGVEKKKFPSQAKKLSLWEKIVEFLKDLFK